MAITNAEPLTDAEEFGAHLTALRENKAERDGKLASFGRISKWMLLESDGHVDVSDQAIANYHHGDHSPTRIGVDVLCYLALFYGVGPDELGPAAAAKIRSFLERLGVSEQVFNASGWFSLSSA